MVVTNYSSINTTSIEHAIDNEKAPDDFISHNFKDHHPANVVVERIDMNTQTDPELFKIASPSQLRNPSKKGPHTYNSFVAYCYCVNYILGVGVLGIPYAFNKGGLLMGPLFLLIVTILAGMVLIWILETLCRAVPFFKEREEQKKDYKMLSSSAANNSAMSLPTIDSSNSIDSRASVDDSPTEAVVSVNGNQTRDGEIDATSVATDDCGSTLEFSFPEKKYEMNELCSLLLGWPGKLIYEGALALCLYGNLWALSTIFAESMSSNVPLPIGPNNYNWFTCNVYTDGSSNCDSLYKIYIGIFAVFVVPMTCLNLTEQKLVQIFLTIFRYVALTLMVVTTFVSIFVDPYSRYEHNPHVAMERQGPYTSPTSLISVVGFSTLLPVCIYSQILHHSVPGLCEPVKNKKQLPKIFTSTFITTFFIYSLLGIVLSIYYGDNIQPACSLNYVWYRGGKPFGMRQPWWSHVIVWIIALFPAVDVISAFPLNGITLGNNLFAAFFSGTKWISNRKIQILFRLLVAIPPLIGALFVKNLDAILKYVGLLGFLITFVIPPLLYIVAKRRVTKRFGQQASAKTPYTIPIISSIPMAVICIVFGLIAIVYCITENIISAIS